MAYATKYRTSFKDIYDRAVQIDFQYDGWGGGVTTVRSASAEIEWHADNPLSIIRGSSASIQLYEFTSGQFDEFFTINQKQCRVYISIDSSAYWYGFVLAGDYQRPYKPAPSAVMVTAVDGLGLLRGVPYLNSGAMYSDRARVFDTLRRALIKTGLDLTYIERVNVYENSMTSGAGYSPLYQSYIDNYTFYDRDTLEPDSCYTVIEKCLKIFNAYIFQENGKWNIARVPELVSACNYRAMNTAGTVTASGSSDYYKALSSNSASSSNFLRFINNNALIKANIVKSRLNLTRIWDKRLIMDPGFEEADASTDFWTAYSSCVSTLAKTTANGYAMKLTAASSDYMQYSRSFGASTGITGAQGRFHITGRFMIDPTSDTGPFQAYGIQVYLDGASNYYQDSAGAWVTSGYTYTGLQPDEWNDIDLYTDNIPAGTYEVKIRLWAQVYNMGSGGYVWYDDVQVEWLSTNSDVPSLDIEYTIDENNLYGEQSDETLGVIDSYVTNTSQMWLNTLSLASEAQANIWEIGDAYSKNLWKLYSDVYMATYMRPALCYQGVLKGQFNYYKALSDGTRRLQGLNVRYNIAASTWDGEWAELNYPGYAETEVTAFTNGTGANAWNTFTDNTESFTATYDNTGSGSSPTLYSYINSITCEDDAKYRIEISITDNSAIGGAYFTFVWGVQSEAGLTDGDIFYFDLVTPASQPRIESLVDPGADIDYTIGVVIKKHYGL